MLHSTETGLLGFGQVSHLDLKLTWCVTYFVGATACVELQKFEDAAKWCDEGLAVSFYTFLTLISCYFFDSMPKFRIRRPSLWALWHHRSPWSLWEGLHFELFGTTGALGACEKAFITSPLAPQELLEPVRRPSLWAFWYHCVFAHRKIIEALSNRSHEEVCKWFGADNDQIVENLLLLNSKNNFSLPLPPSFFILVVFMRGLPDFTN